MGSFCFVDSLQYMPQLHMECESDDGNCDPTHKVFSSLYDNRSPPVDVHAQTINEGDCVWIADLGLEECLNDEIINVAQRVLRGQYGNTQSFNDTVILAAGQVTPLTTGKDKVIQILHDPKHQHWITVSTINCPEGNVAVYCSLHLKPSIACINGLSKLLNFTTPSLTMTIMNTHKQLGSLDCGLFAIAYADTISGPGSMQCSIQSKSIARSSS